MASRNQNATIKKSIIALALLSILASTLAFPMQAYALEEPGSLPTLFTFIESVKDGDPNSLRGIYVQNVMAFAIIQQPMGNPGYVSGDANVLTQFSIATEVGNIGLLAHNHLAGANFSQIQTGDTIVLVYGDGSTQTFVVNDTQQFQALSPLSPYSDFRDLESEDVISAEQLFNQVYRGDFHLTLQTCIENEGNLSWGRLFIIATPIVSSHLNKQTATYMNY